MNDFHFEHHVFLDELVRDWVTGMTGSVDDTLKLLLGFLGTKALPPSFGPETITHTVLVADDDYNQTLTRVLPSLVGERCWAL